MKDVNPCGVCTGADNTIIITDVLNHCFRILTSTGRCLETIGLEGSRDGQFFEPTAVATNAAGCILVCDKQPPRVQKFSVAGKMIADSFRDISRAGNQLRF